MRSDHVRIAVNLTDMVDAILKEHPLFGTKKKFIELAIMEKITRLKK
jgi:hypothetical protein